MAGMVVDDGWRRADFCGSVIEETREINKMPEREIAYLRYYAISLLQKENIKKAIMKSKFLVGTGLIMVAAALCHRLSESKKFLHMISEIFFHPGELVREFHGGL